MSHREDGVWHVLWQEIHAAPKEKRRALRWCLAGFGIALAVMVIDLVSGTSGGEPYRLLSMALMLTGLCLQSVVNVLGGIAPPSRSTPGTPKKNRLHRIVPALPALSGTSALVIAVGLGILVPMLLDMPVLLVLLPLYGFFAVNGVRHATATSRVLYREALVQTEAAAQARAQAAEAQLSALQAQLNPHFLFNALNTVAALVRTDGRAAEVTVENLADVLRRTVDRSARTWSSLAEEMDYLRAYLAVEQERWRERLRVEWDVEPDTERVQVPALVLQPLVENALRHGLGARAEGGAIRIRARTEDDRLLLSVENDGEAFPTRYAEGTGLGNVRRRLAALYGEGAELAGEATPFGARVTVKLPLDREAAPCAS